MSMSDKAIYRSTNDYVIRGEVVDGVLRLYVHQVIDGAEQQPRGYMMGSNCLDFRLKRS